LALQVRQTEVRALARLLLIKLMSIVTLFLAPTLISVLTFTIYFALNQDDIRLDRVFAGLAFINLLRLPVSFSVYIELEKFPPYICDLYRISWSVLTLLRRPYCDATDGSLAGDHEQLRRFASCHGTHRQV
jgi:hypothetical protein